MTVEELRESLCKEIIKTDSFAGMLAPTVLPLIDSLIAAARAEGFKEGVEDTTADLALVEDAETFARGKAEGAEQMKAEIREAAVVTEVALDKCEIGYYVPAAVLAPKEK